MPNEPAEPDKVAAELTARERQVLALLAEGRSSKEIASELQISAKTAAVHRAHIMQKLGVRNRIGATRAAIRLGLIQP